MFEYWLIIDMKSAIRVCFCTFINFLLLNARESCGSNEALFIVLEIKQSALTSDSLLDLGGVY